MKHLSDSALIDLIRQGRRDAFEFLLGRHYEACYAFAFKYCQNQHDAEDILQESLIKISKNITQFNNQSKFTTWAYRIIVNTAKDFFKAKQRRITAHDGFQAAHRTHYSVSHLEENRIEHLGHLITSLPDKLRDAVLLVFGEGLNHKEAASVLGCAETTVSWRVFTAKKELKNKAKLAGLVLISFLFSLTRRAWR